MLSITDQIKKVRLDAREKIKKIEKDLERKIRKIQEACSHENTYTKKKHYKGCYRGGGETNITEICWACNKTVRDDWIDR